jgi:hypothetical protein
MELPGLWLGFLPLPANGGWFTLEFVMEGNESRLGGNKLSGMCGPCCPTVPKRSKNGIVEPRPNHDTVKKSKALKGEGMARGSRGKIGWRQVRPPGERRRDLVLIWEVLGPEMLGRQ